MKYDYLFFDLDGTLTDPALGITNSIMHALAGFGISVADRRELYPFIGPPLLESFQKFYGFSPEQAQRALTLYREYFAPTGLFENTVYDGIPEMLARLQRQGAHIVLTTSKPEVYARRILEHFELDRYFYFIGGSTLAETRVAKAEVIEYCLENCGSPSRERVVMIGDREHDILGAKAAGVDSIGVLYGYGSREELASAGADKISESVSDLTELLCAE